MPVLSRNKMKISGLDNIQRHNKNKKDRKKKGKREMNKKKKERKKERKAYNKQGHIWIKYSSRKRENSTVFVHAIEKHKELMNSMKTELTDKRWKWR